MFNLNESNRYVVSCQGVDLRKGLDGLCGLIRHLSLNPINSDVYVFLNKNRTTMKLLHWERGGFVIYKYPPTSNVVKSSLNLKISKARN